MKDVKGILKDLIALPSINPMGQDDLPSSLSGEVKVAEYVKEFISRLGLEAIIQETGLPGRYNAGAMLFKSRRHKTILLQAHMDTVGIGDDESFLKPEERDGKIYGRGACDDKGSLAAMLAALGEAARYPSRINNNIIVMGVADEEYTYKGSLALVAQSPTKEAYFSIVGEPTGSGIVNGYKGVARWKIETRGKSCHSSDPQRGVNAVYAMGRILCCLEEYRTELSAVRDDKLGEETISVGTIHGGTAVNIVPDRCVIEVDRRLTRRFSPLQAVKDVSRYLKNKGIECEYSMSPLSDAQTANYISEDHPGIEMLQDICLEMGLSPVPYCVGYGSDAYRMNQTGITAVVWGPGSIETAHTDDENISLYELEQAVSLYLGVMQAPEL
jgi:acetylornithine deacetylase/succinyl-diaminopimelate desuccinylase family protein